jgi:hypothetical protein
MMHMGMEKYNSIFLSCFAIAMVAVPAILWLGYKIMKEE